LTASALLVALAPIGIAAPVGAAGGAPVSVGIVYSKTGPLAGYGAQYMDGFNVGLEYATHGTMMAGGHKIVITERDDAGDPSKAVGAAKELIGSGTKILAGSTASGVALQMASVAKENNVLFISGPAATDGVTGDNRNTFRSGRQSYQDVLTAGTTVTGSLRGKHVVVYAQDGAFGQANVNAVRAVLGAQGASIDAILAPSNANDFTPFSQKIKDEKPSLLFVAWAGATTNAMWKSLDDAGVFAATKVVTGLGDRSSFAALGAAGGNGKISFLSYYFPGAAKNKENAYLVDQLKKQGKAADLFSPDGFVAAQMIVHAIQAGGGEDVGKMISSLENWTFAAPKGTEVVRASDHAMLQPMFVARLNGSGQNYEPQLLRTIPREAVAPPAQPFK
jgi:branched-chain amino acid transport system substrate-binding protein